jgi:hypothetical protein
MDYEAGFYDAVSGRWGYAFKKFAYGHFLLTKEYHLNFLKNTCKKNKLMKYLILLCCLCTQIVCFGQSVFTAKFIDKIGDSLQNIKVDNYTRYKRYKGYTTTPYEIVYLIPSPREEIYVTKFKLRGDTYVREYDTLSNRATLPVLRNWLSNIILLELCNCFHIKESLKKSKARMCLPPGTLKRDIKHSFNEWEILYVKNSCDGYEYHSALKCRLLRTDCMTIPDNLRARKRFRRFLKLVNDK